MDTCSSQTEKRDQGEISFGWTGNGRKKRKKIHVSADSRRALRPLFPIKSDYSFIST